MFNRLLLLVFLAFCSMIFVQAAETTVFELKNPDYQRSPYTGMVRENWIQAAEYMLRGAFQNIHSTDDALVYPKQHEKCYPHNLAQQATEKLEGFTRTLFVAAPLLRENPELEMNGIKLAEYYRKNLVSLTNPASHFYIKPRGNGGPSQILVELGALSISMSIIPELLWEPLTQTEKDNLATLMLSYADGPTVASNWRFFNVFVLSFFKQHGYNVNDVLMRKYLDEILGAYRGEGWYNDSPAYDYYSMWAFQMYGVLWADLYGKNEDPKYALKLRSNISDMVGNYPYMFDKDGKMNMWGRSISYRFAAITPLALTGLLPDKSNINFGWMRRISSATLLQFLQHPDFLTDGVPSLGFYGPFEPAVQIYSCRGSVYWMGKAFFALILPADNPFWTATENNGAWENEFKPDKAYNKFQPASELLITNYPNSGASEMRSWCHETVAKDWQKFRSGENYNKLAYNTAFPWMADGKDGQISMNYGVLNDKGSWEVLRLYSFKSFENGIYRRDAILETNKNVQFKLADIPLANGVLRVDKVISPSQSDVVLGHYSLPELQQEIKSSIKRVCGKTVNIIRNGEFSLAVVSLEGWSRISTRNSEGLHPVAKKSAWIQTSDKVKGEKIYITLHLWKKGRKPFTNNELSPVKSVQVMPGQNKVIVVLKDETEKQVTF